MYFLGRCDPLFYKVTGSVLSLARRMLVFVPINWGEVHNHTGAYSLSFLPSTVPAPFHHFPSLPLSYTTLQNVSHSY